MLAGAVLRDPVRVWPVRIVRQDPRIARARPVPAVRRQPVRERTVSKSPHVVMPRKPATAARRGPERVLPVRIVRQGPRVARAPPVPAVRCPPVRKRTVHRSPPVAIARKPATAAPRGRVRVWPVRIVRQGPRVARARPVPAVRHRPVRERTVHRSPRVAMARKLATGFTLVGGTYLGLLEGEACQGRGQEAMMSSFLRTPPP